MISPEVIVHEEVGDGLFEFRRCIIDDSIHVTLQRLLVAFHLNVCLRMIRRSHDVFEAYQPKVIIEYSEDATRANIGFEPKRSDFLDSSHYILLQSPF